MLSNVLSEWGAVPVDALSVYTDMFSIGSGLIQKSVSESHNLKSNPLAYWKNNGELRGHYRVLFDDTFSDTLKELQVADFCILNGLTYFGRKNLQDNANKMYAMIFDLDGVTDETLNNFLSGAIKASVYPIPNYVVLSGHGVHLYYLFEEPISLYPYTKIQLKTLKYALIEKIWNRYTSTEEKKQYQGINQGFRVIGGKSKIDGVRVSAFKLNKHPFTLRQLCEYVPEENRIDESKLFVESKVSLEEAKKKYPEWYEDVVINGHKRVGHWTDKRDLYEWWKRQIKSGATLHHRYFSIMCLAIYAVKSGIDEEELTSDAMTFIPFLNDIAPSEPFTKSDVESALECFDERYVRFPVDDIEKLSGISIPRNKRNYRKQKVHLAIARSTLSILNEDAGHSLQGRHTKAELISEWRKSHPNGSKYLCAKDVKVSRNTVIKWWNYKK